MKYRIDSVNHGLFRYPCQIFLTGRVHPEKASDDNRQPKSKRLYPTMASTVDNWWRQTGKLAVSLALLPYASVQNRHQCTKQHGRSTQPVAGRSFYLPASGQGRLAQISNALNLLLLTCCWPTGKINMQTTLMQVVYNMRELLIIPAFKLLSGCGLNNDIFLRRQRG